MPVQASFVSPDIVASIINQLRNGGIDFITAKIISRVKTALNVFVLIFLFNKSKFRIPENSILIRCNPITPKTKGSKKLIVLGKNDVIFILKKEPKNTSKIAIDSAKKVSKIHSDIGMTPNAGKEDTLDMTSQEGIGVFKPRNSTSKTLDKQQKRQLSFQHHTRSASYSHVDSFRTVENNVHELSDQPSHKTEKVENILLSRDKKKLFNVEVMVWGKGSRGQVGQGDMLDRLQPSTVHELSGCGVIKVVCGSKHSLGLK